MKKLAMVAGRQRDFDIDEALEKAMYVFWKCGYLGASLAELTASMGINKPSLYAAFGNKEDLFIESAKFYADKIGSPLFALLEAEDKPLSSRLENYLRATATLICDSEKPKGCFMTVASTELAAESLPDKARQAIVEASHCAEDAFIAFFSREKELGHLTSDADITKLALFLTTYLHGQAAMARNGKTLDQLFQAIDITLLAFTDSLTVHS